MLKYTDYDIVFQEIPDEVTLAINLSNCPHNCKGCHSPQLMQDIGEHLNQKAISGLLDKYGKMITCVCFMGGDASPCEVERLAAFVQEISQGRLKTGWYSGREKLVDGCKVENFNFIKLGPYKERLGGLNSKTTNQRLFRINGTDFEDITFLMQR